MLLSGTRAVNPRKNSVPIKLRTSRILFNATLTTAHATALSFTGEGNVPGSARQTRGRCLPPRSFSRANNFAFNRVSCRWFDPTTTSFFLATKTTMMNTDCPPHQKHPTTERRRRRKGKAKSSCSQSSSSLPHGGGATPTPTPPQRQRSPHPHP